jgi:hypothetical protein
MKERIVNDCKPFARRGEVTEWVVSQGVEKCAEETKKFAKELQQEVTATVDRIMEKHKMVTAAGGVLFSFKADMTTPDYTIPLFSGMLGVDRRNKAAQVLDNFDTKDLKDDDRLSREDAVQLLKALSVLKNILGE